MRRIMYVGLCVLVAFGLVAVTGCSFNAATAEPSATQSASETAVQSAAPEETAAAPAVSAEAAATPTSQPVKQDSLEAAKTATGIGMKEPAYIPGGYTLQGYDAEDDNMTLEVRYEDNADHDLIFRATKNENDAVGDNDGMMALTPVEETIKDTPVTLYQDSKDDLIYMAAWQKDNVTYSIVTDAGFSTQDYQKMVEGMM